MLVRKCATDEAMNLSMVQSRVTRLFLILKTSGHLNKTSSQYSFNVTSTKAYPALEFYGSAFILNSWNHSELEGTLGVFCLLPYFCS